MSRAQPVPLYVRMTDAPVMFAVSRSALSDAAGEEKGNGPGAALRKRSQALRSTSSHARQPASLPARQPGPGDIYSLSVASGRASCTLRLCMARRQAGSART